MARKRLPEVLDWLCQMDGRYTWGFDGTMINIYPLSRKDDSKYLFNLRIPLLTVVNEKDGAVILYSGLKQLGSGSQQLAFLQIGTGREFPKPVTAHFKNISVRELLNLIGANLEPKLGWEILGTERFRYVTFHERLLPKSQLQRSTDSQSE
jgi:X-X-X-Leu-X-X-Gly heptad repeat protein